MLQTRTVQAVLVAVIWHLSAYTYAADCRNVWVFAASHTMTMDSTISFALTDYKNGERRFSIQQDRESSADIFYLKGAVLVKGYTQAQIEQFQENALFMMPMTFAVPIAVLSEAVPKGPCTVEERKIFSIPLSGAMRLQDRKLTSATGVLAPSAPGEVSYQLDVTIDPPAVNKKSVHYSGTMSFVPQQESPADGTDVTGYLLVGRMRPFPVAGSSDLPARLGELRRFVASSAAQQEPPTPVFFQPEVMSEDRANALIRFTRDKLFWGRAKMFDGKTVIEPSSDEERRSIPIPGRDALWLVSYGAMVGELNRCALDGDAVSKKLFNPFWGRYRQEKQIAFGLILMSAATRDVVERRKAIACTETERDALRRVAAVLLQSSSPKKPVSPDAVR